MESQVVIKDELKEEKIWRLIITTCPFFTPIILSANLAALLSSCITMTIVVPCFLFNSSNNFSMMSQQHI